MSEIKERMIYILHELKSEYGVIAVKAEFEAEGSRLDELIMLNEVVYRADLDVYIKIGGCEAVRDLDQCKLLGASGIMAPMIETPFAMRKFKNAAKKVYNDCLESIEWIINTETKTCKDNLLDIIEEAKGFINTISIGRVDLSSSMGLTRDEINSDIMLETSREFAMKAKEKGIAVGIGGGISMDAIDFLLKIKEYIDRFETRKIVFRMSENKQKLKKGLLLAMEFEMLYLKNKCNFYESMAREDRDRLKMLENRYLYAKEHIN